MSHTSRLGSFVIECHTDHVEHAASFWSEALGRPCEIDEDGNCASLMAPDRSTALVIQGVHEEPGIHLDIETSDLQAEIARLTRIGATKVAVDGHSVVMQAPTGHRFRVMRIGTSAAAGGARPSVASIGSE